MNKLESCLDWHLEALSSGSGTFMMDLRLHPEEGFEKARREFGHLLDIEFELVPPHTLALRFVVLGDGDRRDVVGRFLSYLLEECVYCHAAVG